VLLDEEDLRGLTDERYRRIRGNDIALVSQDPASSLDPTFSVGAQVACSHGFHRGHRLGNKQVISLRALG
jgi:peptide/nickel transport system ATP-binding protein